MKDARLEMRVSTKEKDSLRRRASEAGQTVSNLLRQGVGLEPVSGPERASRGPVEQVVKATVPTPPPRPEKAAEPEPVRTEAVEASKEFKRLVAINMASMPEEKAKALARKRMGI